MASYRINLTPDDNDTFLVTCPALPEVTTFGETERDAAIHGLAAIEEAIAGRIAANQHVPFDTVQNDHAGVVLFVVTPAMTDLKVGLYGACREAAITRAELARRLNWNRNSVDRLFQLDHQSRLTQLEATAAAIGLKVLAAVVNPDPRLRPTT